MMWFAMLEEARHALGANRMRTFLTMLGMIIGVGAVVLMLAIGQGAQRMVSESIAAMGSNLLMVMSGAATSGGLRFGTGSSPTLTLGDADAISELPAVANVAPIVSGSAQLVYGPNNWSTIVTGTTPSYLDIREWTLAAGASFTESDVRGATRVALLGQTVVTNLFGSEDPVGKMVRIKQSPYLVIGVLASKGQSLMGQDQDDTVLVPVTTGQRKLFGTQFQGTVRVISVQATSANTIDQAQRQITDLLMQRHHISEAKGAQPDFDVRNLTAVMNTAQETTRTLSFMLGAIASISLLVGGIGIMNIMLVSVTERTREIGIRVAIGARQQDILLQFLLEAVLISVIGCLVGVILGVSGAWGVQKLTRMTVVITPWSMLLAFSVAAAVGVFFGFYPAQKAARLRPIEALRYQ